MSKNKWKWKGGRLHRKGVSLSIAEAYHLMPVNEAVERACADVLIRYVRWRDEIQVELDRRRRMA